MCRKAGGRSTERSKGTKVDEPFVFSHSEPSVATRHLIKLVNVNMGERVRGET